MSERVMQTRAVCAMCGCPFREPHREGGLQCIAALRDQLAAERAAHEQTRRELNEALTRLAGFAALQDCGHFAAYKAGVCQICRAEAAEGRLSAVCSMLAGEPEVGADDVDNPHWVNGVLKAHNLQVKLRAVEAEVARLREQLKVCYDVATENRDRAECAERALIRAGYTHVEGAQEWKPPLGPRVDPLLDELDKTRAQRDKLAEALRAAAETLDLEGCITTAETCLATLRECGMDIQQEVTPEQAEKLINVIMDPDICDYCNRHIDAHDADCPALVLRRAEDAEAALRVIGEETVIAGLPGGDRTQALANVRTLCRQRDKLAELAAAQDELLAAYRLRADGAKAADRVSRARAALRECGMEVTP